VTSAEQAAPETRRAPENEWHERANWLPSREEMEAYLAREVEMAKQNLGRGFPASVTLHSPRTVALAQQALKENGTP
jgi:hypothetical protein